MVVLLVRAAYPDFGPKLVKIGPEHYWAVT